ncbi:MAG: phage holin family protein [Saprospiraceae bacterium]|nr:phage holin family protein [Saprospiraceae bacterium]
MRSIALILLQALLALAVAHILPGVIIGNYVSAILVVLVLAIINTFIKPILTILTLPITVLTLGLFLIVIDGLMVLLADYLLVGFQVDGLLWAVIFAVMIYAINSLLADSKRKKVL